MSNQHGFLCPKCGSQDDLWVDGVIHERGRLESDGVGYDDGGDFEWEDTSDAGCHRCDWNGVVAKFLCVDSGEGTPDTDVPGAFWLPSEGWGLTLVEDGFNCNIVVVGIDAKGMAVWFDQPQARVSAEAAGLLFEDERRPYKVTGFDQWRLL
jgi:hypothetical protein